jgi:hypothetical protein
METKQKNVIKSGSLGGYPTIFLFIILCSPFNVTDSTYIASGNFQENKIKNGKFVVTQINKFG